MEGTGSYGAKFRQQATAAHYRVAEAPFPERRIGRFRGKSDVIDAGRAARATLRLPVEKLREPRAGEHHMALRVLTVARDSMARQRTAAINSLTALLRVVELGIDARRPLTDKQIALIAGWREREENIGLRTGRRESVRLAKQITSMQKELDANRSEMDKLVQSVHPALLEVQGVGPVNAALILTACSHTGRGRSEAAFAALADTCPIPASSGSTNRYRLNRGGDRQLNKALHTIALVRMNYDQGTKDYIAKRTGQGRTKKEIIPSLKRYITRQIYRQLNSADIG